ncbi:matrixin family metalloprotease [Guggenheimella bovis]
MLIVCVFLLTPIAIYSFGYSLDTSWKFTDPQNVTVYLSSNLPYYSDVKLAYDNWDSLPEVETYWTTSYYYPSVAISYSPEPCLYDAYAITTKYVTDKKLITICPNFLNLPSIQRKEVVSHEMGHAFGLNHSNTTQAIMRETGFNNNAYPLQDDKNGIAALY